MPNNHEVAAKLSQVLATYQQSFSEKVYSDENNDYDPLMAVFDITPDMKRENRQYWGRELGMCWQLLIVDIFENLHPGYKPALRIEQDEPCDLVAGNFAIDTKYRIGSGDSGTLKKFRAYGELLTSQGYDPIFLILREDNLPAAIHAVERGNWTIYMGSESFQFIESQTGFDLLAYLEQIQGNFRVTR